MLILEIEYISPPLIFYIMVLYINMGIIEYKIWILARVEEFETTSLNIMCGLNNTTTRVKINTIHFSEVSIKSHILNL